MRLTDEQRAANADTLALLEYIRQGGALPDDYSDSALADRIAALRAALARIDELETALADIVNDAANGAPGIVGKMLVAPDVIDAARALLQPAAPEAHDG